MKRMITIIADEGKVLTNGKDYGTTISLADGVSDNGYYEITKEEYEQILAEQEEQEEIEQ